MDEFENSMESLPESPIPDAPPATIPRETEPETSRSEPEPAPQPTPHPDREPVEHYTDASYIPRDQAPRPPRRYSFVEPQRWERRRGVSAGAVILLCLLFLLIGVAGTLFLLGGYLNVDIPFLNTANRAGFTVAESVPEPSAEPSPVPTPAPTPESTPEPTPEPTREPARQSAGTMAPTTIYELACRQVVGITSEITYQSYFGTASGSVTGCGFVIDSAEGYILTNYHIIADAMQGGFEIHVILPDGQSCAAQVVGCEQEESDLAVLCIGPTELDPVKLGSSADMKVGETVYAVGNPTGKLEYTMTGGMISARDREITSSEDGVITTLHMFQFDAAVNEGNSGGPVYNAAGAVIGVVTAKAAANGTEGLGFAIPIDSAMEIANELIEQGYIGGKAYLGISGSTVSSAAALYYNLVEGVYINEVYADSCAGKAGLQRGDILMGIDRYSVASLNELTGILRSYTAGENATLHVFRDGERLTLEVVFDEKTPQEVDADSREEYTYVNRDRHW